jgi:hypothetical protein
MEGHGRQARGRGRHRGCATQKRRGWRSPKGALRSKWRPLQGERSRHSRCSGKEDSPDAVAAGLGDWPDRPCLRMGEPKLPGRSTRLGRPWLRTRGILGGRQRRSRRRSIWTAQAMQTAPPERLLFAKSCALHPCRLAPDADSVMFHQISSACQLRQKFAQSPN